MSGPKARHQSACDLISDVTEATVSRCEDDPLSHKAEQIRAPCLGTHAQRYNPGHLKASTLPVCNNLLHRRRLGRGTWE